MVNFGWSYPPGCSGTPGDESDPPCYVCGLDVESCICPECAECGSQGDPECYDKHGLVRSEEHIASLLKMEQIWHKRIGVDLVQKPLTMFSAPHQEPCAINLLKMGSEAEVIKILYMMADLPLTPEKEAAGIAILKSLTPGASIRDFIDASKLEDAKLLGISVDMLTAVSPLIQALEEYTQGLKDHDGNKRSQSLTKHNPINDL